MINPIIRKTVSELKSTSEKIDYLFYVYKGWILLISLTILFISGILFSYINKKESVLTIRVISVDTNYENLVLKIKQDYEEILNINDGQIVDVVSLDLSEENNQDVFIAQLVAQEIDLILLDKNLDVKMTQLFEENGIKSNDLTFTDEYGRTLYSRIPSFIPHPESWDQIQEYEINENI